MKYSRKDELNKYPQKSIPILQQIRDNVTETERDPPSHAFLAEGTITMGYYIPPALDQIEDYERRYRDEPTITERIAEVIVNNRGLALILLFGFLTAIVVMTSTQQASKSLVDTVATVTVR